MPAASPPPAAPAAAPKSRTKTLVGWIAGCLSVFLVVVALLVGALIYGILNHQLVFFAIGLGGLVLIFLVGAAVEHWVRRLIRRFRYTGSNLGVIDRPYGGAGYQRGARPYRQQQPRFSLIRFLFTLALLAAAIYGGLFLYYTQTFAGNWSGVLSVNGVQQGILANLQVSLSVHRPGNFSTADLGSIDVTQVDFKPTTAQVCKSSQGYQLSGTASRLDAASVAMTLSNSSGSLQLHGSYKAGTLTLSGTNAQGKPVTLTLQKGTEQQGYVAACG